MTRLMWAQLVCFLVVTVCGVVGAVGGSSTGVTTALVGVLGALCVLGRAWWGRSVRRGGSTQGPGRSLWSSRLVSGFLAGLMAAGFYLLIDQLWLGTSRAVPGAVIVGVVVGLVLGFLGPDQPARST